MHNQNGVARTRDACNRSRGRRIDANGDHGMMLCTKFSRYSVVANASVRGTGERQFESDRLRRSDYVFYRHAC